VAQLACHGAGDVLVTGKTPAGKARRAPGWARISVVPAIGELRRLNAEMLAAAE